VVQTGAEVSPTALQFDDDASRRLERIYSTPDVVEQRRAVLRALALRPSEHVLDIGTGPGLLAAAMAAAVGPGGSVRGIDMSESMLALARRREPAAGAAPMEFLVADANALPFERDGFEVAVSTQVYEYVADLPAALAEVHRVLRPGGRLLVLDTDWDSIVWRSGDDARMRRVLAAWDEHLADPHLPRRLGGLLERAGFAVARRAIVPLFNTGYSAQSYSAGLIELVSAFVPGRQGITPAETTAWADDLIALGRDYFFSVNRYLFVAVSAGRA
jgi:arsenite methyltransferase